VDRNSAIDLWLLASFLRGHEQITSGRFIRRAVEKNNYPCNLLGDFKDLTGIFYTGLSTLFCSSHFSQKSI
jgi:hypothetical protein